MPAIAQALPEEVIAAADGWRISGRKIWTSNAPVADYCVIFAVTDPDTATARRDGITGSIVPTETDGFSMQVGYRAVDQAMQTLGAMGFTNELGLTEV